MVIFDVDDFSDQWPCIDSIIKMKLKYPYFRATLFTITKRINPGLLDFMKLDWLEFAVHGFTHEPNDELLKYGYNDLVDLLESTDYNIYKRLLRPPGWYINERIVQACNQVGLSIAIHEKDSHLIPMIEHGYYICNKNKDHESWHGHSHNVCGNWIDQQLPSLLDRWPIETVFGFVSEALIK